MSSVELFIWVWRAPSKFRPRVATTPAVVTTTRGRGRSSRRASLARHTHSLTLFSLHLFFCSLPTSPHFTAPSTSSTNELNILSSAPLQLVRSLFPPSLSFLFSSDDLPSFSSVTILALSQSPAFDAFPPSFSPSSPLLLATHTWDDSPVILESHPFLTPNPPQSSILCSPRLTSPRTTRRYSLQAFRR